MDWYKTEEQLEKEKMTGMIHGVLVQQPDWYTTSSLKDLYRNLFYK
jgi:hypothetical protein